MRLADLHLKKSSLYLLLRKILPGPAVVGMAFVVVVACTVYYEFMQQQDTVNNLSDVRFAHLQLAMEANAYLQEAQFDLNRLFSIPGKNTPIIIKATGDELRSKIESAIPALNSLSSQYLMNLEERSAVNATVEAAHEYARQVDENLSVAIQPDTDYSELLLKADSAFEILSWKLATLVSIERKLTTEAFAKSESRSKQLLLILAISLVAAGGLAFYLYKRTTTAKSLLQANAALKQANDTQIRILAGASHDLRQPLFVIGLLVNILRDRIQDPEINSIVEKAASSVEVMGDLVNAFLEISELDAHRVTPKLADVPIADLFEKIDLHYRSQAEEKGLAFRIVQSCALAKTDRVVLDRVVHNLVANSIQYTDHGSILIGCRRRRENVEIQIWDTGIGIPEEKQQEIFQEFVQLSDSGRERGKGLGLGLSIVQRLANLMGYTLSVQSQVGKGSMFSVRVPMAADKHFTVDANLAITSSPLPSLVGTFLVVVDDEQDILFGMAALLTKLGCHVLCAKSGEEAMQKLDGHLRLPDLIISDYQISRSQNGLDAIRMIRDAQDINIPAIIITGCPLSDDLIATASTNDCLIIHKPISDKRLHTIVGETLERAKLRLPVLSH